jgi:hypothetical protein
MICEGLLVLSSNSGRYAIADPEHGMDLTSGTSCEIFFGTRGEWIKGTVEHDASGIYAEEGNPRGHGGYYFIGPGGIVGLCVGMKVRVRT